jgi:hypothetical protein
VGIGPSLVAGRPTPGAEVVERGSGESRRIQRPADVSFPDGRGQRGPSPLARPESDAGGCCRCCRSVFSYPSPARRCRRSGDLESCWRTWIPSFLPRQHYVRTPAPPATSLPPLSLNLAVFAPPPPGLAAGANCHGRCAKGCASAPEAALICERVFSLSFLH